MKASFSGILGAVAALAVGCGSDGNSPAEVGGDAGGSAIIGGSGGSSSLPPPVGMGGSTSAGGAPVIASGNGGAPTPSSGGALGGGGTPGLGGAPEAGGAPTGGAGASGGGAGGGGTGKCLCRSQTAPTAADLDKNGPYQTKSFTMPRTAAYGGATVYYPVDATPPFAAVTFCPPYTATQSAFAAWGPFYASHGIVLATMDTLSTGDQVVQRADELAAAVKDLKAQNSAQGGPLNGKIDLDRLGVMGWSMGGGATWITSGKDPEFKSAITLAGHNATATGWEASAKQSKVPTLMMNGATDTSILGGQNQTQNAYAAIPDSTPKLMYIMSDLGHFDWGTPAAENHAAGRYAMAWEKYYLENDDRYKAIFLVTGPNASTWQTNVQ